jgi:cytochrome c553
MKTSPVLLATVVLASITTLVALAQAKPPGRAHAAGALPDWAYPVAPPGLPQPDPNKIVRVPGSDKQYSETQVAGPFSPPDWFPNEHPPMPPVVADGIKPAVFACDLCHLPTGAGHPESSSLWGLQPAYFLRQMADYAAGKHKGPRKGAMTAIAKAISADDDRAAADYFAGLKATPGWDKVVEAAMVPKSVVGEGNMRFATPGGGKEPIGERIIVLPVNEEAARARNPHFGFIDYVPPGSIAKGRRLAEGGGGKTVACAICQGPGLRGGLGEVPSIAGRGSIFIVRQLMDFKSGRRAGEWSSLHDAVDAHLDTGDIIALAAYVTSLKP